MRSSAKLAKLASLATLVTATLVPNISSSQDPANVHIKSYPLGFLGAGQITVYTQTQQGVVYTPRPVLYSDGCCTRPGIGFVPTPAEIVTGRCVDVRVDWNRSIFALPGKGLAELRKGINCLGDALTPKRVSQGSRCVTRPYCGSVQYDPCTQYGGQEPQRYLAPTPVQPNIRPDIQQPGNSVLIQPDKATPVPAIKVPAQPNVPAEPTVPVPPVPSDDAAPAPASKDSSPSLSPPVTPKTNGYTGSDRTASRY